jgi:hypothetical protein
MEEGMNFAKNHNLLFIETSAKEATNVSESFTKLLTAIVNRYYKTGFDDNAKTRRWRQTRGGSVVIRTEDVPVSSCC